MRERRAGPAAALLLALALPAVGGARAAPPVLRHAAQPKVIVIGPADADTLRNITPTFAIRTEGFAAGDRPTSVRIEISRDQFFSAPSLVTDSLVPGEQATITLSRPLPERARIYWRGVAYLASGDSVVSDAVGPRVVPDWLRLVSPNARAGNTLETRRPTFVWSSAQVAVPPGPWVYTFAIFRTGDTRPLVEISGLIDTTFTPAFDLESNVSYRWSVTARLASGESTTVPSAATFVIVDPGQPRATLLFQNFPNPFPNATTSATCIWFDLREASVVRLTVYDLRGMQVRTLIPSGDVSGTLPPGRYGRAPGSAANGGCDPNFTWDGRDAAGRTVPPGVYLLRLSANGAAFVRKMLFVGR